MRRNNGGILYKIKDNVVKVKSRAVIRLEIKSILACVKLNLVKVINLEVIPSACPVGEGIEGISEVYSLAVYRYPEVCAAPTGNECDTDLSLSSLFYVKLVCNVGVTVTPVADNCATGCSFLIKDEGRIAVGGSTVGINRLDLNSITIRDGRNCSELFTKIYDKVVEVEAAALISLNVQGVLTCFKLYLFKIVNLEVVPTV